MNFLISLQISVLSSFWDGSSCCVAQYPEESESNNKRARRTTELVYRGECSPPALKNKLINDEQQCVCGHRGSA